MRSDGSPAKPPEKKRTFINCQPVGFKQFPDGAGARRAGMMTTRNRQAQGSAVRRELTLALQALYAQDISAPDTDSDDDGGGISIGIGTAELIEWLCLEEPASPAAQRNAAALVSGVAGVSARIDAVIQNYAPALPVNLLAVVDRSILRVAIYELTHRTQIPRNVVVNEAVELAARYGSESSARFVNGVLGSVLTDLPPPRRRNARTAPSAAGDDTGDGNENGDHSETP